MKNLITLKRVLLVATLALLPVYGFAQVQEEWAVQYNGKINDRDWARAMVVDSEGNVFVTGSTYDSIGGRLAVNYATMKYNSSGQLQWITKYGGTGGSIPADIALDPAGNVYVTGRSTGINSSSSDYATVKYDPVGNELWVRRYNGPDNEEDEPNDLAVDAAGNVYVTGESNVFKSLYTDKDYATLKYNTDGVLQWVARYSGPSDINIEAAWAVAVDAQGNVYVTGQNNNDYTTIKYNRDGVEQWIKTFDGLGHDYDFATDIKLDAAGNIYVTGHIFNGYDESGIGLIDYATIKYNPEGEQQWVSQWDSGGRIDFPVAMAIDAQGNVYVTGSGDYDYTTVKYDTYGNEQWVQRYYGPGYGQNSAGAIALDNEGNVYITGTIQMQEPGTWGADGDIVTIKYSASGEQQWLMTWGGVDERHDSAVPHGLGLDAAGNVYVSGNTTLSDGTTNMIAIKYAQPQVPEGCNDKEHKVAVCHKGKTICISANALKAHLKHGDQLGECNEMASNNSRESGMIAFEDADLLQVSLYPNPVSGTAKIYYQLPAAGAVSIQVIDMQGRAVASVLAAEAEAGNHLLDFDTSQLPLGLYVLKVSLSTPRRSLVRNQRMVVVR